LISGQIFPLREELEKTPDNIFSSRSLSYRIRFLIVLLTPSARRREFLRADFDFCRWNAHAALGSLGVYFLRALIRSANRVRSCPRAGCRRRIDTRHGLRSLRRTHSTRRHRPRQYGMGMQNSRAQPRVSTTERPCRLIGAWRAACIYGLPKRMPAPLTMARTRGSRDSQPPCRIPISPTRSLEPA
jgi:hypothetical protein